MLYVQRFIFNALAENTYVVYDDTKVCAIIDPGCYTPEEQAALSAFIKAQALQVRYLINTHAHIDHILGNHYIHTTYQVPLTLHRQEIGILQAATQYAVMYNFEEYTPATAEIYLHAGDVIQLGTATLAVLHVPGHSPGHIALYSAQAQMILSGDVLFKGSIGNTNLPYSDPQVLLQSIHQQLFTLDDHVVVYPGHGPTTTIGQEKRSIQAYIT